MVDIIPRKLIVLGKVSVTYLKYYKQLYKARRNYDGLSGKYMNDILFVAGLPKSGTSWLENMLADIPGYEINMIPGAVKFEQLNKGSHHLELKSRWLNDLNNSLTVLKLHCHGSENNVKVLEELQLPYVVLFRDLRDVAVSHYFYVRNTWHHPEYKEYKELTIEEGLRHFAKTLLPFFKEWIYSWKKNHDENLGMLIRYEDMKKDTLKVFKSVIQHYNMPVEDLELEKIVKKNSFEALSGGRDKGQENTRSFFRKGVSGDWKNHFTDDLKALFKKEIGQLLIDTGYERDLNW